MTNLQDPTEQYLVFGPGQEFGPFDSFQKAKDFADYLRASTGHTYEVKPVRLPLKISGIMPPAGPKKHNPFKDPIISMVIFVPMILCIAWGVLITYGKPLLNVLALIPAMLYGLFLLCCPFPPIALGLLIGLTVTIVWGLAMDEQRRIIREELKRR
jgi:hypothetical protein